MDLQTYSIHHFTEVKDGDTVHDFDVSKVPTEFIQPLVHTLTFDLLARCGVKYEHTQYEKQFGIKIDYFRALKQAIENNKTLIDSDFRKERERNHQIYLDGCKQMGVDPRQMYLDFPV